MKNTFTKYACLIILVVTTVLGCKTINPGEVGFLVQKGKIKPGILAPGRHQYDPFASKIRKFNTRITEFSAILSPPTKEGLEVKMDLTVLYHIKPEAAPDIYNNVGMDYGNKIVINNFMAIVREYTMSMI